MATIFFSGIAFLTTGIIGSPDWIEKLTLVGALIVAVIWFAKREKTRERKLDILQEKMFDLSLKSTTALTAVADQLKKSNELLQEIAHIMEHKPANKKAQ